MTNENKSMFDYLGAQISNSSSASATQLAYQIKAAILKYKAGGENHNAFSISVKKTSGHYMAQVSFSEEPDMTVIHREGSNDELVQSLFDGTNDDEVQRIAILMLA